MYIWLKKNINIIINLFLFHLLCLYIFNRWYIILNLFICYFKKCIYYNYKRIIKINLKIILYIYYISLYNVASRIYSIKGKNCYHQNLLIYNADNYITFLIGHRKFINLWNMLWIYGYICYDIMFSQL